MCPAHTQVEVFALRKRLALNPGQIILGESMFDAITLDAESGLGASVLRHVHPLLMLETVDAIGE